MLTSLPSKLESFPSLKTAVAVAGIGTATGGLRLSQLHVLDFVLKHFDIQDATKQLYKKTLGNAAIRWRHFAMNSLGDVLDRDHDRINARFQSAAVALGSDALKRALQDAGLRPADVDFLAVTTCTGYLCPGLAAYLIDACGLRSTVRFADVVGMGCGAAIPAMEQAHNFLAANPGATAAIVSVEICSAAMYSSDDVDIVISNTIFADGAASVVLWEGGNHDTPGPRPRIEGFSSVVLSEWRDTLRFKTAQGYLKNVLGKNVPEQAAAATAQIAGDLLRRFGLRASDIEHWILHAGGAKIIDALQRELDLSDAQMASSRAVLENHGNMSSPTVLFVLDEERRRNPPQRGAWGFVASFGAGFSAHGTLIRWT